MLDEKTLHWYALKVFYNRVRFIGDALRNAGWETYVPMHVVEETRGGETVLVERQLISSLMFARMSEKAIYSFKKDYDRFFMYYADIVSHKPAPIPDHEMEMFILVTSTGERGVEYVGGDAPEYHVGDKVRVTGGIFKGCEGHIKRRKKDRRLFVSITGVAVVMTPHIDFSLLEKIEPDPPVEPDTERPGETEA